MATHKTGGDIDAYCSKYKLTLAHVIIAMDGRPVRNASDLRNDIGLVRVGTTIELTVLRGGERLTVRPRVAPAPAESRQRRAR